MTDKKEGSKHPPLEPQVADRLLELLSVDEEFRQRFANDPASALREAGHDLDAGVEPSCMMTEQLASKEEIAAVKEQLRSRLMASNGYTIPHFLEAGKIDSALRRK